MPLEKRWLVRKNYDVRKSPAYRVTILTVFITEMYEGPYSGDFLTVERTGAITPAPRVSRGRMRSLT
jgi:hypothetical protein